VDGFDAARAIRGELPDVGLLFLTGSNSPADIAKATESGADGYVLKDRIATDLIDAILGTANGAV
jgi:DNA-binding NarL/FixJ family response regulator